MNKEVKEEILKERLRIYEILHAHAMQTKDVKTLDLLEAIQKEVMIK